ncbi:hypothetical protein SAMN05216375_1482 [Trichococcus ilyis]|uniref:Uncharacterized protein n=1 Tax=Trichococcus ilyis TaxID=640938 RepID=A0A143ZBV6_9LACT|nr:Hypothetical protein TR210_2733 [Trichococcus ilyis]SEJ96215.1 hypothetical protein SAMN05216375_1482 [Trichococcus ilyis]
MGGGRTPAKPQWSEVMIFLDVLLRVAQLRRANVGRRTLRGGRLNFGEAAVVEDADLFGCFPPAGGLCPELGASSD